MLPKTINIECSQFLNDASDRPLIKYLPSSGEGFRKIKLRKRKYRTPIEMKFDKAFGHTYKELSLRSLSIKPLMLQESEGKEKFYIFPIDGYKCISNPHITSLKDYMQSLDGIDDSYIGLLETAFQYGYKETTIRDALLENTEIIIYNVPYFFAVRCNLIDDYKYFVSSW